MALFKSGLATTLAEFVLRFTGKSETGILLGILAVSAVLSAFSSNTAVVLMMIPLVKSLSEEGNISLKRTMYPLGIGAAIGGALTLVGTTSNVAGLVGLVLLILTGCISEKDAYASIDWKLFMLIVSFGVISSAITNSGGG